VTDGGVEHRRVKSAVRAALFGRERNPVRIGRFVVLERLGVGGMGVVYSAYDDALGRKVAIKIVREDRAFGERASERLRREAQAVARLNHPNVVQIFEVGTHIDELYVAMEFVEGVTLRTWAGAKRRSWSELRDVFVQAAEGLAAAHDAGLVHRDFKPDNVVVSSAREPPPVKVLDFGLATVALDVEPEPVAREATSPPGARLTGTGDLLGTPRFMSPEQHRGHKADARSDQYAFCLSLWEALFGDHPFVNAEGDIDLDAMSRDRLALPAAASALPRSVHELLRRGLGHDPARRFASMHEIVKVLRRDPARAVRRVGASVLGVGVTAGAFVMGAARVDPVSSDRCSVAFGRVEALWGAPARRALQDAVVGANPSISVQTWEDTTTLVDEHLAEWSKTYRETCDTAGSPEQREHSIRTQLCLEANLRSLEELLRRLEHGDLRTVHFLPGNVRELPVARDCVDEALARERERREAMLRTPLPEAAEDRLVSDFEVGIRSSFGAGWRWFGNAPDAADRAPQLSWAWGGANDSSRALRIAGEASESRVDATWSGAMFYPGDLPGAPVNFTEVAAVHFWARGQPGTYALALFTAHGGGKAKDATFELDHQWQEYRIFLDSIEEDRYDLTGLFFGTYRPGPFELLLDEVIVE